MAGKGAKYEHDTVSVARGKVAETVDQRQTDGWELVDQDQGILRTKLTFRRPKPPDRTLLWIGVGLAVIAVVVAIGVIIERAGGGTEVAAPTPPAATTTPPAPTPTPTETPAPSPEPTTTEPEPGPLWVKADGPVTFQCVSGDMGALVRFDMPAAWPYIDELNAILHEFDGRKPVTVLPVVEEHAGDWTSFIALTLETSKGTITIDHGNLWGVSSVLWDTGLIDPDRKAGSKKLRARADALVDRMVEDSGNEFVLPGPITHIDSARAEFLAETGRYYPDCEKAD